MAWEYLRCVAGVSARSATDAAQDWHLAKRFYDLSLETNTEAYLPVMLSLIKLYARR
jgi:hypothetical protein